MLQHCVSRWNVYILQYRSVDFCTRTVLQFEDFRFAGTLRTVDWWLVADVSGEPIGPILKGQGDREESVANYQCTMLNIVEERRFHLYRE